MDHAIMPSRSASEYSAMLSLGVTIDYFSASRGLLVPHTGNGLPATGAWHRGTGGSHECKDDRRRNNTRSVHNTAPRHSSPQSAERSTVESAAHAPLHRIHRRGIDDTCRSRPAPTSHHSPTAPSQPPASHPRCPPSLSTLAVHPHCHIEASVSPTGVHAEAGVSRDRRSCRERHLARDWFMSHSSIARLS